MQVRDAIGGATNKVYTVDPGDTIADSVDLLAEYGIGAVVVVTKDKLTIVGIISERDVVRHLCHEQEGTLRLKVEDLMTENVLTCTADDEVVSVMTTMLDGRFRHMPVVDGSGHLCGIVSLGDLARSRLKQGV